LWCVWGLVAIPVVATQYFEYSYLVIAVEQVTTEEQQMEIEKLVLMKKTPENSKIFKSKHAH
jgi:hypothetical protein